MIHLARRARALFQIVRPDLEKTKTPLRSWRLSGSIPYLEKKMTDQPQQTNHNDHRYYPEDEIELMDYLLVIWKWKYLILAGTLVFGLVAAIKRL